MDKRSLNYNHPIILPGSTTHIGLGTAFHYGLSAGILGVAAMTLGEKLEQLLTHRPNSYVPAYTLARLLHLSPSTTLTTTPTPSSCSTTPCIGAKAFSPPESEPQWRTTALRDRSQASFSRA